MASIYITARSFGGLWALGGLLIRPVSQSTSIGNGIDTSEFIKSHG